MRQLTGELLDRVAGQGGMEVVDDLAYPLPANIIADMFGMPTSDRWRLRTWSREIAAVFHNATAERLRASQDSVLEMQDYLRTIVADRRAAPRDDLIGMFVAAEREGVVTEDEIVANCVLLLFAGHETTANLIAHGLNLLLANPDQPGHRVWGQRDVLADPACQDLAGQRRTRCHSGDARAARRHVRGARRP